jgi:hypothetical protein
MQERKKGSSTSFTHSINIQWRPDLLLCRAVPDDNSLEMKGQGELKKQGGGIGRKHKRT